MKNIYTFLIVLATPAALLLMSNSSGSPGGKTGSPGDGGNTCTQCHTGTANTVDNWITTNIPAGGYVAGETYTITATGTHSGVSKFGFELTVENNSGQKAGTLQITEPTRTKLANGGKAVTHLSGGTTPSGNTNTWTMNWVAPAALTGTVGIYAAFNAANGNGNTSGDVIYKSNIFVSPAPPPIPMLVSIEPNTAQQSELVSTVITGTNTNFSGSTMVSLKFSQDPMEVIQASSVNAISSTQLEATFGIPAEASAGLWNLHVDLLTLAESFTVTELISSVATEGQEPFKIYPNPTSGRFYIENAAGARLTVQNLKGERLMSEEVQSDKQVYDAGNLAKGLYVVRLDFPGHTKVEKLLVH